MERLKCKKGMWQIGFLLVFVATTSMTALGLYKTAQNGVLKNNGKKIWCKMTNKGEDFCNEKYEFTPDPHHWEYLMPKYVKDEEV